LAAGESSTVEGVRCSIAWFNLAEGDTQRCCDEFLESFTPGAGIISILRGAVRTECPNKTVKAVNYGGRVTLQAECVEDTVESTPLRDVETFRQGSDNPHGWELAPTDWEDELIGLAQ